VRDENMEETDVGVERNGEGEFDGVEGVIDILTGKEKTWGSQMIKRIKLEKKIVCRGKGTIVGVERKFSTLTTIPSTSTNYEKYLF
jgi:hypothetical protein